MVQSLHVSQLFLPAWGPAILPKSPLRSWDPQGSPLVAAINQRAMGGMELRLCQGCGWEAKLALREGTKGKRQWGSCTSRGHVSCAMHGCPGLGGTQQREHSSADSCQGQGRWQGQGGKGAPQGLAWSRSRECGSLTPVPLRYQPTCMSKAQQVPLRDPQILPALSWRSCAPHPVASASSKLPQTAQWATPPPI